MLTGVLICESLRVGASLDTPTLTLTKISRIIVEDATEDQPSVWTLIEFRADAEVADELATAFTEILQPVGWYVDFHTPTHSFVVFAGKPFRYPRGDVTGRSEACNYGRSIGIPESQLDWAS